MLISVRSIPCLRRELTCIFAGYLTKLHKVCKTQEACMLSGWRSLCWGFEYGCIVFMCLFGAWQLIYRPKTNYFVLSFFICSIKYIKRQSCRGRKQLIYYWGSLWTLWGLARNGHHIVATALKKEHPQNQ